jgi:hypothetical protein
MGRLDWLAINRADLSSQRLRDKIARIFGVDRGSKAVAVTLRGQCIPRSAGASAIRSLSRRLSDLTKQLVT